MNAMEFRDPHLLPLALLAVPVFLLARRSGGHVIFSSLRLLPQRSPGWRARLLSLPPILLALATAAYAVALAGPRTGDATTRIHRRGIAIQMVVDISGSMSALDLSEEDRERTRLDAVLEIFRRFVAGDETFPGRPDDAIGLVTFARYPDSRCPLTLDHAAMLLLLDDVEIVTHQEEDGTALGDGLGLAIERLRRSPAASRIVILLTDGVQNAGEMTPLQAAQVAESLGIKVYAVGAGTEGLAPVRVVDPFTGRKVLRRMHVQIDEKSLREIARRTGGRYFRATDADSLARVYEEIDRLERTRIEEVRYLQYHEYFESFAGGALGALWAACLLGATWLRRMP